MAASQPQGRPPPRRISRLLVANRGEIATRIIHTARELDFETYALSTTDDTSHTLHAAHVLSLSSPASYLSVDEIIGLVKKHGIDAVHPGYGFLSESAEFAKRLWDEAGASVVGPGWDVLERTGDKLRARKLAAECDVPVLEATEQPLGKVDEVKGFVERVGLPIMLKAVDGGGGRGIRLVKKWEDLENLAKRAMEESPSKQVFVEKAAVDGFRHVEVQIIGDGERVEALWERECSIQRRYQKIVELAPSTIPDREFVAQIISAAKRIAEKVNYFSLGTFEFLANPSSKEFFFLEVNPRLQVEHTITESISLVDIVQIQLELAQGAKLDQTSLGRTDRDPQTPPPLHSIQWRVTAENVQSDWSLSIGKISSFHFPTGNGIRIDTGLVAGHPAIVSSDFDSLIAKIIVTAPTWEAAVRKSSRALRDTHIQGVQTNLDVLRAIVASEAFAKGQCDTVWLEKTLPDLLESGKQIAKNYIDERFFQAGGGGAAASAAQSQGLSSSTVLFRKGDAWSIKLAPKSADADSKPSDDDAITHHLKLQKVLRNEFPSLLSAEIDFTPSSSSSASSGSGSGVSDAKPQAQSYTMTLSATSATSSELMAAGKHRRGDASNPRHVIIPFSGKLVEVLVDEGDTVGKGDVVCVVQQMKMELEVRAARGGVVKWVTEAEDGEDVGEGALAVEFEEDDGAGAEGGESRAKL